MHASAFAVPSLPLSSKPRLLRPNPRSPVFCRPHVVPRAQCPSRPPDSSFTPENDLDYQEVRVLSFGPSRNDGSLLTLRPTTGGNHAFKMNVTTTQADSIRSALGINSHLWPDALHRPGTHDLFKNVLDLTGAFVTKAAITHIQDEVFIARVWLQTRDGEIDVDARPSDAIAMATRCRAPLYLNTNLLRQWNVSLETVERDARHGLCERVEYSDAVKSSRSIREEVRRRPEHLKLAKLKMELDLAVRLERFGDAILLKEKIERICPIDRLQQDLQLAVEQQRFLDAANIQDQITVWRARLRMWEKGTIELDTLDGDQYQL